MFLQTIQKVKKIQLLVYCILLFGILSVILYIRTNKLTDIICEKCNVILISVDTLGAKHMSVYDEILQTTPLLKERAKAKGIVFKNAFAQAPWTLPSHTAMLTGEYPWDLKVFQPKDAIPENAYTLAEALNDNGYGTYALSNGAFVREAWGFDQGFDLFFGSPALSEWNDAATIFNDAQVLIEQARKPYFLFLHSFHPHDPYTTPEQELTLEDALKTMLNEPDALPVKTFVNAYHHEITQVDTYFEQFMQTLEDSGMLENTVVIFTSDHGEEFGEHGLVAGHGNLYKETIHVPLIFFVPNTKARSIERITEIRSLPKTILTMLNIPDDNFSGDAILQADSLHDTNGYAISATGELGSITETIERLLAVYPLMEDLPTLLNVAEQQNSYDKKSKFSVITNKYHLIQKSSGEELYEHTQDTQETQNMLMKTPKNTLEELRHLLKNAIPQI